jgi:hypothetical protein
MLLVRQYAMAFLLVSLKNYKPILLLVVMMLIQQFFQALIHMCMGLLLAMAQ